MVAAGVAVAAGLGGARARCWGGAVKRFERRSGGAVERRALARALKEPKVTKPLLAQGARMTGGASAAGV